MPYSKYTSVLNPFGLTLPFKIAEVAVMYVAEPVVTEGSADDEVVKVWSFPEVVPMLFVATSLKWYMVLSLSPVILALTDTSLVPDPALVVVVVAP